MKEGAGLRGVGGAYWLTLESSKLSHNYQSFPIPTSTGSSDVFVVLRYRFQTQHSYQDNFFFFLTILTLEADLSLKVCSEALKL